MAVRKARRMPSCSGAAPGGAQPGAPRAPPPLGEHAFEPGFLARLRAEGLDHRVVADGVAQRPADAGVLRVRQGRGRRDEARRQEPRRRHVDDRAETHEPTHGGPARAQHRHGAEQHHDGRQEGQEQHVVEFVERPHAAGDHPHGRARERVGVPLGRQALNPGEAVARDVAHGAQRQRHDEAPGEVAQPEPDEAQPRHGGEGRQRRPDRQIPVAAGEGVDEPPRVVGEEHVGERRERDGADQGRHQPDAPAPAPDHEGKHAAEGVRAAG